LWNVDLCVQKTIKWIKPYFLLVLVSCPLMSVGLNSVINFQPNFPVLLVCVSFHNCNGSEQYFRNRIINEIATACIFGPQRLPFPLCTVFSDICY
jgi:hypothetical protein